ncbi:MAG: D-alanine--D-alanine ligase [Firmicutes bacterium]|nr:D-alanine--D-alanine ligase [Bacillota bacterium]
MKLAVIFGGKSTEHNISIVSATSIISNLDKGKYKIFPIYISRKGLFYKYTKSIEEIKVLQIDEEIDDIELIDNIFDYLKNIDVVFPVLHGLNGEDGTIQGFLEMLGKPYVGCKVLASSLCMDKVYTKRILNSCGIEQAKSIYLKKHNNKYLYLDDYFNTIYLTKNELIEKVSNHLKFPVFIKPSNSGSSVGVHKSFNQNDFIDYLEDAFKYDSKVLIEEFISGREVECAILGNNNLIVSTVGEIVSGDEFYSYDSKYKSEKSYTMVPAKLDENIIQNIQNIAKKAYVACDCKGLSRVDFFVEKSTNRIILNEINTMPGFTEISMYPQLIEHLGISYSKLLDYLINLTQEEILF